MSRFQLLWAILMFTGIGVTLMIALLRWRRGKSRTCPIFRSRWRSALRHVLHHVPDAEIAGLLDAC
jgi:hypothetical protein